MMFCPSSILHAVYSARTACRLVKMNILPFADPIRCVVRKLNAVQILNVANSKLYYHTELIKKVKKVKMYNNDYCFWGEKNVQAFLG